MLWSLTQRCKGPQTKMLPAYDIKEKPRALKEICRPEKSGYLRYKLQPFSSNGWPDL